MKISIAMATYNGAKYLQEQLDSFVAQTCQPDELVVCDDGSADDTVEILERFRERAPFTVAIHRNTENLGYAKNFEKAMGLCNGDLIFLSDQDDVWFPNKLQVMSSLSERNPWTQIFICDMVITDAALNSSRFTQLGNMLNAGLTQDNYVTGCGTALRRRWLQIALPMPPAHLKNTGHDYLLHYLASPMSVRMVHAEPLQFYRRHENNISSGVVSRPSGTSLFTVFREHGFADSTAGWLADLDRIEWARDRFKRSQKILQQIGLQDRLPTALERLNNREIVLRKRITVTRQSRYRRWLQVAGMWIAGDYRQFSGLKSVIKDILR